MPFTRRHSACKIDAEFRARFTYNSKNQRRLKLKQPKAEARTTTKRFFGNGTNGRSSSVLVVWVHSRNALQAAPWIIESRPLICSFLIEGLLDGGLLKQFIFGGSSLHAKLLVKELLRLLELREGMMLDLLGIGGVQWLVAVRSLPTVHAKTHVRSGAPAVDAALRAHCNNKR